VHVCDDRYRCGSNKITWHPESSSALTHRTLTNDPGAVSRIARLRSASYLTFLPGLSTSLGRGGHIADRQSLGHDQTMLANQLGRYLVDLVLALATFRWRLARARRAFRARLDRLPRSASDTRRCLVRSASCSLFSSLSLAKASYSPGP